MSPKIKVLIIDDNGIKASSLGMFLLLNGFDLGFPACSFELAVEILANEIPDIVLMEINIQGNEMECKKIANFIDAFYHLPVIFMSNNEEQLSKFKPSYNHIALSVSNENPH